MRAGKKYTFERKQIVLVFAGNCLILLLVFVLGVKVGKDIFSNEGLPSDQEILEKIKPEKIPLTFPISLSDGGSYVDEISPPKNLPIIPTPLTPLFLESKNTDVQRHKKKKPKSKTPKRSKYSVQIGSYNKRDDAKKMVGKYKKLGFDPYIVKIKLKNRSIRYRVRVGRNKTKSAGQKMLRRFAKQYGLKPLLILLQYQ